MSSKVEICNLAMSHLGEYPNIASIDPPEGGAHAELCAQFYPIAHQALLERHSWAKARRRANLVRLTTTTSIGEYIYQLPSDFLMIVGRVDSARPVSYTTDDYNGFAVPEIGYYIEGDTLITTLDAFELIYISQNTEISKLNSHAQLALSHHLASLIESASGRNQAKIREQVTLYEQHLSRAITLDANQHKQSQPYLSKPPVWISAR